MIFGIITLVVALSISAVAAFYSIVGLMAIFSAAAFEIALMGGVLEVGKLITASWLYQNWKNKLVPHLLRVYLSIAVVILVFITSIGIFGFLSKAHLDQVSPTASNQIKIENLQQSIAREQLTIDRANIVLLQLDEAVNKYIELDYVTKALEEREKQREDRETLSSTIDEASTKISELEAQVLKLQSEIQSLETEVGPLKYVAELIYGTDDASSHFDNAVRLIIMIFIFVFDPLAVLLVISANITITEERRKAKRRNKRKPSSNKMTTQIEEADDGIQKITRTVGGVTTTEYR